MLLISVVNSSYNQTTYLQSNLIIIILFLLKYPSSLYKLIEWTPSTEYNT